MQNIEQLVSESYNACWKSYKEYITDHNMMEYNKRSGELVKKYQHASFVENNLLLFAPVVQEIHDATMQGGNMHE
ncbi:MAG: hypothetical protein RSC31_07605 [Anaerovoracaceae bacterium]